MCNLDSNVKRVRFRSVDSILGYWVVVFGTFLFVVLRSIVFVLITGIDLESVHRIGKRWRANVFQPIIFHLFIFMVGRNSRRR